MNTKKFFIKTFGCQMNEYDSERMASILEVIGYEPALEMEEASVVIINTCSVREKPQNKVASLLGRLKPVKAENPELIIGVSGCVAQQEGENLLKSFKNLDFVMGTDSVARLGNIIDKVRKGSRVCETKVNDGGLSIPVFDRDSGRSAFVTVMKGCDNFCSYCIVPYVRGREKSRMPSEIRDEVRYLVDSGVKEITLLGQNVNSYGIKDNYTERFPDILSMVNDIEGVKRIRFVTSHPKDFSVELMHAIRDLDKVCEYLHLPLQAGSDKILKLMNRGYTYGDYKEKVLMAKEIIPDLALSSDFIAGFPGETEEDFECTLKALKEIKYETLFAFNYSVRPGTAAVKFGDDVPMEAKSARLNNLLALQKTITAELCKNYIGKTVEVMVEGRSVKNEAEFTGRNRQNRVVNFSSSQTYSEGDTINVRVSDAKPNSLYGEAVE